MLKKILSSTIIKLVLAVIAGILLGFVVGEGFMNVVVTLKYILGQLIFFMVPLIILAFISSSIAKMKGNASRMLGWALECDDGFGGGHYGWFGYCLDKISDI